MLVASIQMHLIIYSGYTHKCIANSRLIKIAALINEQRIKNKTCVWFVLVTDAHSYYCDSIWSETAGLAGSWFTVFMHRIIARRVRARANII